MQPSGRAVLEAARLSGKADALAHVDALEEPRDLIEALKAAQGYNWWYEAAPSYRRNILRWIATAKKPETRAKRNNIASDHAAQSKKVPNY